jgi:tRNA(fMet)-specific endonuclease VapC
VTGALYLLDTDTASFVIKGRSPEVEARLAEIPPDRICVSAVTRAELMYGLKRIAPSHPLQVAVPAFLKIVQVRAWDADAADVYAEIRHQLTSTGQPIGDMDMMIAAHAIAIGAVLVTNNTRHFGRIAAPLVLMNWREGAA